MPIYEYQCEKCRKLFELLQSIHDKPLVKCPKCSGKVKRLVSHPAILFKGSGFHVTDYRSRGSSTEKSQEKSQNEAKPETSKKKEDVPESGKSSGQKKSGHKTA